MPKKEETGNVRSEKLKTKNWWVYHRPDESVFFRNGMTQSRKREKTADKNVTQATLFLNNNQKYLTRKKNGVQFKEEKQLENNSFLPKYMNI